jgi:hypothetical protein
MLSEHCPRRAFRYLQLCAEHCIYFEADESRWGFPRPSASGVSCPKHGLWAMREGWAAPVSRACHKITTCAVVTARKALHRTVSPFFRRNHPRWRARMIRAFHDYTRRPPQLLALRTSSASFTRRRPRHPSPAPTGAPSPKKSGTATCLPLQVNDDEHPRSVAVGAPSPSRYHAQPSVLRRSRPNKHQGGPDNAGTCRYSHTRSTCSIGPRGTARPCARQRTSGARISCLIRRPPPRGRPAC